MGKRIYYDFKDVKGTDWTVEVHDTSFSGTATAVVMGASPFKVRWSGDELKLMIGSEVTLTYITATDLSWMNTNNGTKLEVKIKKETILWWNGFILPDEFYQELMPLSVYTVMATDRLGILAQVNYSDASDIAYEGWETAIVAMARALKKTGLALPIRSMINLFEEDMNIADGDDPLNQIEIDQEVIVNDELEPGSCYSLLDYILRAFQASIKQSSGYWIISRNKELDEASVDYRDFDSDGAYVSNNSYAPEIITNKSTFAIITSSKKEVLPAYRRITVNQDYGKRTSLFTGFKFPEREFISTTSLRHWTVSATSGWERISVGDGYMMMCAAIVTFDSQKYLRSPAVTMVAGPESYLLTVKLGKIRSSGTLRIELILDATSLYYCYIDPNDPLNRTKWGTANTQHYLSLPVPAVPHGEPSDVTIEIPQLPFSGDVRIFFYDPCSTADATLFYVDDVIFIPKAYSGSVNYEETGTSYQDIDLQNNVEASYLMPISDIPYSLKINNLIVYKGGMRLLSSGEVTKLWFYKTDPSPLKTLVQWVIDGYLDNGISIWAWRGSIKGQIDYFNTIQNSLMSDAKFILADIDYDIRNCIISGNAIEIRGIMTPIAETTQSNENAGATSHFSSGASEGGGTVPIPTPDPGIRRNQEAVASGEQTVTFLNSYTEDDDFALDSPIPGVTADGEVIWVVPYAITNEEFKVNYPVAVTITYQAALKQ